MSNSADHWQRVYAEKEPTAVSWFQSVPTLSLSLIDAGRARENSTLRVLDVGGGASTLVDHLVRQPFTDVWVVDIAAHALEVAQARLGERAGLVRWTAGDVTGPLAEIPDSWAHVWHDRAAFHFLSESSARTAYARNLARILRPGGTAIIATFAPDGPTRCSGLEVCRHNAASIVAELGSAAPLKLVEEQREDHTTPWGAVQRFVYAVLRRES